ncbi:uncharacterized protein LOC144166151 isoform X2 [Haemaphysalis longicornis]
MTGRCSHSSVRTRSLRASTAGVSPPWAAVHRARHTCGPQSILGAAQDWPPPSLWHPHIFADVHVCPLRRPLQHHNSKLLQQEEEEGTRTQESSSTD